MEHHATPLPPAFAHLSPFADWALPTETERNHKRVDSHQFQLVAFSRAMMAEIDSIIEFLNGFPLNAMPPEVSNLYYMLLALAEIAPAIECYGQPGVVDGFDSRRFVAEENFVLRPKV